MIGGSSMYRMSEILLDRERPRAAQDFLKFLCSCSNSSSVVPCQCSMATTLAYQVGCYAGRGGETVCGARPHSVEPEGPTASSPGKVGMSPTLIAIMIRDDRRSLEGKDHQRKTCRGLDPVWSQKEAR